MKELARSATPRRWAVAWPFLPWSAGQSPLSFRGDTFLLMLQAQQKTEIVKGVAAGSVL